MSDKLITLSLDEYQRMTEKIASLEKENNQLYNSKPNLYTIKYCSKSLIDYKRWIFGMWGKNEFRLVQIESNEEAEEEFKSLKNIIEKNQQVVNQAKDLVDRLEQKLKEEVSEEKKQILKEKDELNKKVTDFFSEYNKLKSYYINSNKEAKQSSNWFKKLFE